MSEMVGSNIYRVREWTKCVCESICISFYCTSSLLQLETFKELVTRAMCIRDDSLNPPHDVSFHSIFVSFLRNLIARIFSLVTWNDLDSRTVCISRTQEDRTLYFLHCFALFFFTAQSDLRKTASPYQHSVRKVWRQHGFATDGHLS